MALIERHDTKRMGFGLAFTFEPSRCLFGKSQEELGSEQGCVLSAICSLEWHG